MAIRHHQRIPLDTAVAARERQIEAWIAMGPEQRVRLAASMSDDVRRVARDGLVARTPGIDSVPKPPR
jgi:hypothetical protein